MIERLFLTLTFFFLIVTGLRPCVGQPLNVDSLVTVLKTTQIDTSKVNLLYRLSDAYTETKPDKAIEYANQGLTLSKKIDFTKGQSICLNALGLAYYQIGKFDSAMIYFERCHKIVKELRDSLGIARVYDNIGSMQDC